MKGLKKEKSEWDRGWDSAKWFYMAIAIVAIIFASMFAYVFGSTAYSDGYKRGFQNGVAEAEAAEKVVYFCDSGNDTFYLTFPFDKAPRISYDGQWIIMTDFGITRADEGILYQCHLIGTAIK